MKSILDSRFHYRSSVNTDLKKTFAKIRREQRRKRQGDQPQATGDVNVVQLPSRKT